MISVDRSSIRRRGSRPDDTDLRARLREPADQRRRFGYRRLHVLLRQEGHTVDRKKARRLYREEGLMVRRRKSRRRIAVASPSSLGPMARRWQPPIPPPTGPNSRWSLDFVHDRLANGRRFRVLNVIDDVTKECLAAIPDTSISGKRVVREMRAIIERRGKPDAVVGDDHCPAGDLQGKSAGRGHRVHVNGRAGLHTGARARPALHRAREANPERHGRKLPRPDARRMPK